MKKTNFIYLIAAVCILVFIPYLKKLITKADSFYGIAENQIRSINYEFPIEVESIYKFQGESVNKGDTIIKFRRLELDKIERSLTNELLEVDKKNDQSIELLKSEFNLLLLKKNEIQKNYEIKIQELNRNKKVQSDIMSQLNVDGKNNSSDKYFIQEQADLEQKKQIELNENDLRIRNLKKDIIAAKATHQAKYAKIKTEIEVINKTDKKSYVVSPDSGIIGQLEFSPGDKIQAYNSILKIYSTHPFTVNSFIPEGQLSQIKIGDSVFIASLINQNYILNGTVSALGTRITALPERLKKIPEIRAWGREMQINIPKTNLFMQGEKVKIELVIH